MYALRRWSVRHARGLNAFYRAFESVAVCAASGVEDASATRGSNGR